MVVVAYTVYTRVFVQMSFMVSLFFLVLLVLIFISFFWFLNCISEKCEKNDRVQILESYICIHSHLNFELPPNLFVQKKKKIFSFLHGALPSAKVSEVALHPFYLIVCFS